MRTAILMLVAAILLNGCVPIKVDEERRQQLIDLGIQRSLDSEP